MSDPEAVAVVAAASMLAAGQLGLNELSGVGGHVTVVLELQPKHFKT